MLSSQGRATVCSSSIGTSKDQIFGNEIGITLTMGSTWVPSSSKSIVSTGWFSVSQVNSQYKMVWNKWETLKINFSNIDSQRYYRFMSLVILWSIRQFDIIFKHMTKVLKMKQSLNLFLILVWYSSFKNMLNNIRKEICFSLVTD